MTSWQSPGRLDRAEDRRGDPAWVARQWEHPAARVLAVSGQGALAWSDGAPGYRPAAGPLTERQLLLGLLEGEPVFIDLVAEVPDGQPLRVVMEGLDGVELELAFTASALAGWHHVARFCSSCATPTQVARAGLARRCPGCGRETYPRVDPAVIVAITDPADRLLLGRQAVWAPGRMSVFAGFLEAGESLEQAVYREVLEEVGLCVTDVQYLGSQPWPFPRSVMVAFRARAADPHLTVDTTEIEQARWFSREDLAAALATREVLLPSSTSIAYRMIAEWRSAGADGGARPGVDRH